MAAVLLLLQERAAQEALQHVRLLLLLLLGYIVGVAVSLRGPHCCCCCCSCWGAGPAGTRPSRMWRHMWDWQQALRSVGIGPREVQVAVVLKGCPRNCCSLLLLLLLLQLCLSRDLHRKPLHSCAEALLLVC